MSDQSHTPLPLSVEESVPSDGFNCFWIKDANGNVVGDVYGPQHVRRQQELASAIVRSVNSLPSLVKALEEARESLAVADKMISAHIEKYHDFDYEPYQVPPELSSLRAIEHHLMGSLILDEEIAALSSYRGDVQ